jgi:hypothetical protein
MSRRLFLAMLMALTATNYILAEDTPAESDIISRWRSTSESPEQTASPATVSEKKIDSQVTPVAASLPIKEPAEKPYVPVEGGNVTLPNDAGQVWRDYDITSYTTRVTTTKRPEQAVVDWILRETGYEAWHSEPLGVLSAGPRKLRVYHTPEMQKIVADLVDRFVSSEAATYTFSLRVITLDSPSWRTQAQRLLQAVPVQTPGMNAWMLAKEDAAILLGELRRRSDYREHSSPYLMVNNGQSTLVSAMRGRPYVRDVLLRPDTATGFDPSPGQVDEGFNLDFSPLLSADRRLIDAVIRCDVDQVEKMIPIMLEVPTQAAPRQRTPIEVPQITHYRFHERFRWPIDRVLLVGMGMVALPIPVDGTPLVPGIPLPIGTTPARADLLVFVECKGPSVPSASAAGAAPIPRSSQRTTPNYRGRY